MRSPRNIAKEGDSLRTAVKPVCNEAKRKKGVCEERGAGGSERRLPIILAPFT